ncbi:MAG: LamG-like jellyroll fold domain-containing protein [bacterium]
MNKVQQLKEQGYTMIEMAIVIFIIVILSTILFANYHGINRKGEVLNYSEKLKRDLRQAQNYSLNLKMFDSFAYGWGIKVDRTTNSYTVFADKDNDKKYSYPVKLLIHGDEYESGVTFNESSKTGDKIGNNEAGRVVNISGTPNQTSGGGRPDSSSGYWEFKNVGDYLEIDDNETDINNDFDFLLADFVIDLWFDASIDGNKRSIICKWDENNIANQSFHCYKTSSNEIECSVRANSEYYSVKSGVISSGWNHLAFVRKGRYIKLYLTNEGTGIQEESIEEWSDLIDGSIEDNDINVQIGSCQGDSASSDWNGDIDEIRIAKGMYYWDRKFDLPQVQHKADEEKFKTISLPPGVIFYRLMVAESEYKDSLDIYFFRDDLSMYIDGATGDKANVILNNIGDEDMLRDLEIEPSGLIKLITPL